MPEQPEARRKDFLLLLGLYLLIFSLLLTPFFPFAFYLLPFPLFLLTITYRYIPAVLLTIALGGVVLLFGGVIPSFVQLLALVVALAMGSTYRRTNSTGVDVVLVGLIVGFISVTTLLAVAYFYFPAFQQFLTLWEKEIEQARLYWEQMGVTNLDPSLFRLNLILPIFLFMSLVPLPLITHWLGGKWLQKRGFTVKGLPPFRHWRLPKVFFHFYIAFMLVYFFTIAMESHSLDNYLGLLYILHILFVIQGISFIAFLLDVWRKNKAWLFLIIFPLITPMATLIQIVGLLDTGFRIREWVVKMKKE